MTTCNNCGATDWREVHEQTYGDADRRRRLYVCEGCGAEGKRFDRGRSGTVIESGAMR